MGLAIIKLGGSVLTEQVAGIPCIRSQRLRNLAREIANCGRLILVHGSGAFGKPPARLYGYLEGHLAQTSAPVVCKVSRDLEVLHSAVLDAVYAAGKPVCSFQAAHLFHWKAGALRLQETTSLQQMLCRGLTPVIASGFVPNLDSDGFTVASSDAIAFLIAQTLQAQTLAFVTDADGVYKHFPDTSAWHRTLAADNTQAIECVLPTDGDVTGGMAQKLHYGFAAAQCGVRTLVVDGRRTNNLIQAYNGQPFRGTELVASSNTAHSARSSFAHLT